MKLDDSELFVTKKLSFYKTESYNMTRNAFVKEYEVDKMDMLNLGTDLAGEKKEEVKEDLLLEDNEIGF